MFGRDSDAGKSVKGKIRTYKKENFRKDEEKKKGTSAKTGEERG